MDETINNITMYKPVTITSNTPSGQPSIKTIHGDPKHVAKTIAILKNQGHTNIQVQ